MYSLKPEHLPEELRNILARGGPDRRLSPDRLPVAGEVNRMIAAAINVNPQCFWHGPDV
jgi:hypothetical protein